MTSLGRRLLLVGLSCGLAPGNALAHDPFEITTEAVVSEDALELRVTMPEKIARALKNDGGALYVASSAGHSLPLARAVSLPAASGESAFRLVFGRPDPGLLRLTARHLETLPEGYTSAIELEGLAPQGALGRKLMHREDRAFEIQLPERPTQSRVSYPAAAIAAGLVIVLWALQRGRSTTRA